jgi:hypothetical protein
VATATNASTTFLLVSGALSVVLGLAAFIVYRYRTANREDGDPISWGQSPTAPIAAGMAFILGATLLLLGIVQRLT